MIDNAEDLQKKALDYKTGLKKQYVNILIGDEESVLDRKSVV